MAHHREDAAVHAGEDQVFEITIRKEEDNSIQPLGSLTSARYAVAPNKNSPASAQLLLKILAAGEIVVTDAPNGLLEITMVPADLDPLSGTYWHLLEAIIAGRKARLFEGELSVEPSILGPWTT